MSTPQEKLNVQDFARRVRSRTGAYEDVPDDELVRRVLQRYPDEYGSVVEGAEVRRVRPDEFAREHGFEVTSTTGGRHNKGSAHYAGGAADVRTRGRESNDVESFLETARAAGFRVRDERVRPPGQPVWNGPHGHLEGDGVLVRLQPPKPAEAAQPAIPPPAIPKTGPASSISSPAATSFAVGTVAPDFSDEESAAKSLTRTYGEKQGLRGEALENYMRDVGERIGWGFRKDGRKLTPEEFGELASTGFEGAAVRSGHKELADIYLNQQSLRDITEGRRRALEGEQAASLSNIDEEIADRAFLAERQEGAAGQALSGFDQYVPDAVENAIARGAQGLVPDQIVPAPFVRATRQRYEDYVAPPELTDEDRAQVAARQAEKEGSTFQRGIPAGVEEFLGGKSSQVGNVLRAVGKVVGADTLTEAGEYLRRKGTVAVEGARHKPEEVRDSWRELFAADVPKALTQSGLGLAEIVALRRATGASFPSIMVAESAASNLDKSPEEQARAAREAYATGHLLEKLVATGRLKAAALNATQDTAMGYREGQRGNELIARGIGGAAVGAAIAGRPPVRFETPYQEQAARIAKKLEKEPIEARPLRIPREPTIEDIPDIPVTTPDYAKPVFKAKRYSHRDFGTVEEASSQAGVARGKVRVVDEAGAEHVIQRPNGRGDNNRLAVPMKEAAVDSQNEARLASEIGEGQAAVPPRPDQRAGGEAAEAGRDVQAHEAARQADAPVVPERPETIDAQIEALTAGRVPAVLVTPGAEKPTVPQGYVATPTDVGTFIHDPKVVRQRSVRDLAQRGEHGRLLGHVEPKSEATTETVVARDEQGRELKSSVVSPENVPAQAAELKQQFPQARLEAGGPEKAAEVIAERTGYEELPPAVAARIEQGKVSERTEREGRLRELAARIPDMPEPVRRRAEQAKAAPTYQEFARELSKDDVTTATGGRVAAVNVVGSAVRQHGFGSLEQFYRAARLGSESPVVLPPPRIPQMRESDTPYRDYADEVEARQGRIIREQPEELTKGDVRRAAAPLMKGVGETLAPPLKPPTRYQQTGIRQRGFDPQTQTLAQFVRSQGGIRVDRDKANAGELRAFTNKESGTTGIVNNRAGHPLEYMTKLAAEAGFPVLEGGDYLTGRNLDITNVDPNRLLGLLERDLSRGDVYSRERDIDYFETAYRKAATPDDEALESKFNDFLKDSEADKLYTRLAYEGTEALSREEIGRIRELADQRGIRPLIDHSLRVNADRPETAALLEGDAQSQGGAQQAYRGEGDSLDEVPFARPRKVSGRDQPPLPTAELFSQGPTKDRPKLLQDYDRSEAEYKRLSARIGDEQLTRLRGLQEEGTASDVRRAARTVEMKAAKGLTSPDLPDLTRALSQLAELRRTGTPVGDYLNQGSLFGGRDLSPAQEELLKSLDVDARGTVERLMPEAKEEKPSQGALFNRDDVREAVLDDLSGVTEGKPNFSDEEILDGARYRYKNGTLYVNPEMVELLRRIEGHRTGKVANTAWGMYLNPEQVQQYVGTFREIGQAYPHMKERATAIARALGSAAFRGKKGDLPVAVYYEGMGPRVREFAEHETGGHGGSARSADFSNVSLRFDTDELLKVPEIARGVAKLREERYTGAPDALAVEEFLAHAVARNGEELLGLSTPEIKSALGRMFAQVKERRGAEALDEFRKIRPVAREVLRDVREGRGREAGPALRGIPGGRGGEDVRGIRPPESGAGDNGRTRPDREAAREPLRRAEEAGQEREVAGLFGGRAPTFYSQLERVVTQKMPARASSSQLRSILTNPQSGVRADEVKWAGLDDYLREKETVTKREVLDFLAQNNVRVEEVVKGQEDVETKRRYRQAVDDLNTFGLPRMAMEAGMSQLDAINLPFKVKDGRVKPDDLPESLRQPAREFLDLWRQHDEAKAAMEASSGAPKFEQYTLPGAREGSYRELLLTLPEDKTFLNANLAWAKLSERVGQRVGRQHMNLYDAVDEKILTPGEKAEMDRLEALISRTTNRNYRSSHFDEPNVLAHVRFNERTDAEGKRVLFVEEIQSDWHQEGRKKGYGSEMTKERAEAMGFSVYSTKSNLGTQAYFLKGPYRDVPNIGHKTEEAAWGALLDYLRKNTKAVPAAPFSKTWHELAFKRILRHAAESGSPAWRDVTQPESVRKQVEHHLGRELAAVAPLKVVDAAVLPSLKHDQVRKAVVELVPVDVVNVLSKNGFTPEDVLRKPDVVGNALSVNDRATVARGLARAVGLVGARLRAEARLALSPESAGRDRELLPALRASDLNPREVVGLLAPSRLYHTDGGSLAVGEASTRPAAKSAEASLKNAGESGELSTAELAEALNRHDAIISGRTGDGVKKYDPGYEKLAWTTGEIQAVRYDLSKQVDAIHYVKDETGAYSVTALKGGNDVVTKSGQTPAQLEELVGKEIAERIVRGEGEDLGGSGVFELKGDGLKVGGEGMKGFYDRILPAFAAKYGKKWGARVTEAQIPERDLDTAARQIYGRDASFDGLPPASQAKVREVVMKNALTAHALDITPAMKKSVVEEGQPLFAKPRGKAERAPQMPPPQTPYQSRPGERGAVNLSALRSPKRPRAGQQELAPGLAPPLRKPTFAEKVADVANVPRSLKSSIDLSAAMRQGAMFTLTHPVRASRTFFGAQLRSLGDKGYEEFKTTLQSDPDRRLMKDSGLHLTSLADDKIGEREEAFASRLVGRLPVVGGKVGLVRRSEQAYVTFLDASRSQWFKQLARQAEDAARKEGLPVTQDQYKQIAKFVNRATGRGDLGKGAINDAAPILNAVFFAPRYAVSKVQVLDPRMYARMPKGARKTAIREAVQYYATVGTAATLLKYGLGMNVGTDPEDSDFLKLRIGDTRYDLTAGHAQYFTLASRLLRNIQDRAAGAKPQMGKDLESNVKRFLRYKLAPVPAGVLNAWQGKNAVGEETTVGKEAIESVVPLYLADLVEAYQKEGAAGIAKNAPGFVGVGVQTYGERTPAKRAERKSRERRGRSERRAER